MQLTFKKDRFLLFFFVCLAAILAILLGALIFLYKIEKKEMTSAKEAYISLTIARDLRQSSDDLTKMVRLYVLTGDPDYLSYYHEILSIRNGTSPRPMHYDEIYWDFVLDCKKRPSPYGKARSLKQVMMDHNFSSEELALLSESQARSDALVALEVEAINAMQGRFNNGSGDYTVLGPPNKGLAEELVSSPRYMEDKAKIMEPLLQFSRLVQERVLHKVEGVRRQAIEVIMLAFILAIFAYVIMIVCLLKASKSLKNALQTNEGLLLNMLPSSIADRLKKGEHSIQDTYFASILFVHIRHFTQSFSAGVLTQVFDRIERLAEEFGVEKIKILGESYMVVSGIPTPIKKHEERLAAFALALQKTIAQFNEECGLDLGLRIGMASGMVIAGIIGTKKFIYDLWGDTVTLAASLESSGEVGKIQVSEEMRNALKDSFLLEERKDGTGEAEKPLKTYFLVSKK